MTNRLLAKSDVSTAVSHLVKRRTHFTGTSLTRSNGPYKGAPSLTFNQLGALCALAAHPNDPRLHEYRPAYRGVLHVL